MSFDLGQLAIFHAVAETGGVSRAAERLMVSQPAVSKQLNNLQRVMKTRLLERDGRGVRLTQAGRVLAGYTRQIFALVAEAETALTDLDALRRGSLAVGVTPTVGTYLLPDALVYFRQRFPGVVVHVETADTSLLGPRVADGSLDLAIGDETLAFPYMQRRQLAELPFVAIAATQHPLARKKSRPTSFDDLNGEIFVTRDEGTAGDSLVARYLAQLGIAPTSTIRLGSTEAVKRAVQAGLGIAIVPRLAVENELSTKRLAALRLPDLKLTRTLYETWTTRRPRSKAAQAFHCVLEHAVRGTLPSMRRG